MPKTYLTITLLLIQFTLTAQNPFITTWKTDNPGTSEDNQITIPTTGDGYDFTVDWGDETRDSNVTGTITHTYAEPGTYTVSISGDFPRIYFNGEGDREKILTVEQWGDIQWSSMAHAFEYCTNLRVPAIDAPELSLVIDMSYMFYWCSEFNEPVDHWDVSNIIHMTELFGRAAQFNQPLDNWDVSNVVTMNSMFSGANSFNQPLDIWDVSNVQDMSGMLAAHAFNQPINNWDVSSATDMSNMFSSESFNQPLDNWDVSNVQSMRFMFWSAKAFDQNITNWDVSNVLDMDGMFENSVFNQPLDNWNVGKVLDMHSMFQNSIFNQPLDNWDVSNVEDMNSMFAGNKNFNQSLNSWNVENVTNMDHMIFEAEAFNGEIGDWNTASLRRTIKMFQNATSFNQPIENWDMSKVLFIEHMFDGASSFNQPLNNWDFTDLRSAYSLFANATEFNQPIDSWDVSILTSLSSMFQNATNFNQSLASWDISNVTTMSYIFDSTAISTVNFDSTLLGWSRLDTLGRDIVLSAAGLTYCFSETARQTLIDDYNWRFTGDELGCIQEISLSANTINEGDPIGTLIGILDVTDLVDETEHSFALVDGDGSNDLDNSLFDISGNILSNLFELTPTSKTEYFINVETINQLGEKHQQSFVISANIVTNTVVKQEELLIYPNPNQGFIKFGGNIIDSSNTLIELYDINGIKLLSQKFQRSVNISSLKSGTYILKIQNSYNNWVKRILKI